MGWRFRKSFGIGKYFRVNLSKSGTSFSFGRPGARVSVGKHGITKTFGVPGTGVYRTDTTPWNNGKGHNRSNESNISHSSGKPAGKNASFSGSGTPPIIPSQPPVGGSPTPRGGSFMRKIPGFRSNVGWKKAVGVVGYIFIALVLFIPVNAYTAGDYCLSFLEKLLFFIVPYILIFNIGGLRKRLPLGKSPKTVVSLAGAIFFSVLWMIPAGIFTGISESSLHSPAYIAEVKAETERSEATRLEKKQMASEASAAAVSKAAAAKAAKAKEASEAASRGAASQAALLKAQSEAAASAASEQAASKAASDAAATKAASDAAAARAASDAAAQKAASEAAAQKAASDAAAQKQAQEQAAAQTQVPANLQIVSLTSPVGRNEYATVTIKGAPNTSYTCTVTYKSGRSTADGLGSKTSGPDGTASWSWKVGGNTTKGAWPITITGGGQTVTQDFTVD